MVDELEAAFQEPYLKAASLQRELSGEIAKVQHYAAEIEKYKLQIARQEQHYAAEVDAYKQQLARQERHYGAEIDVLKHQIARQEEHYTGEFEKYKSQIDSLQKHLTDTTNIARKLSRLLENVEKAAERLANSRRWKFANLGSVIKAMLSRGKLSIGYDPLEKIVAAYSQWRVSHPEIGKLNKEIGVLQSQANPETSAIESDKDPRK